MASSESGRPLPTPPPPRPSIPSVPHIDLATIVGRRAAADYMRSNNGSAPAEPAHVESVEATEVFRPGSFAPETAIDEQIQDLERWVQANLIHARNEKVRFWVLRGLAISGALLAALMAKHDSPQITILASVLCALCVAVDAAWPSNSFRNVHQRAVCDLRELQNTLKLRWDKVCLAHPDSSAPQRTAHALAMLDQVQSKREEIGRYLGSAEASPGIQRDSARI
ncbi:MAG TPA: hypothetical protein VFK05_08755 [Polyangiaceae bacterium]|nr:hypothetical protein [Polyangiaceae bacterium]